MKKFKALVTNDDGIDSVFLHQFVEALIPNFEVNVAAPSTEQSWIGRAISRHKSIKVLKSETLFPDNVNAWSISGTPTDCVNIALGHLLEGPPDIILSGINLGYNTTEILILSSGTIAGAIEGSLWGFPSIAFSQEIPKHLYEEIHSNKGISSGDFYNVVQASVKKAAEIALQQIQNKSDFTKNRVLNVNFPKNMNGNTNTEWTRPEKIHLGSLFRKDSNGNYCFEYTNGKRVCKHPNTDRSALRRGNISISLLDFGQISLTLPSPK